MMMLPRGAFGKELADNVPVSTVLPKVIDTLPSALTVPCAGLHECTGFAAVADAEADGVPRPVVA